MASDAQQPDPIAGTPSPDPGPVSYADAGVDLEAADRSVALIAEQVRRTHRPEVLEGIGGFGGLFAFDPGRYRDPILVSGTDGVGTKVELARRLGVLDTVGQDLVAMVVDDLAVCGAEPLFFNDYLAVGQLDPERVAALVTGIATGCELAGCALVGGETAEHPGLLAPDAFDLAGFGVGVVEREDLLGSHRVVAGDVLLGLASSGLHSNGYSLVRRIIDGPPTAAGPGHPVAAKSAAPGAGAGSALSPVSAGGSGEPRPIDLSIDHGFDRPLGEVLLEPTRIYARDCLVVNRRVEVHAWCHITGGGLPGNLPRVLPAGLAVEVDVASWTWPRIFTWLAERGPVTTTEMWRTFNCGVGMVAVVAPAAAADALAVLAERGVPAWELGRVVERSDDAPTVAFVGA